MVEHRFGCACRRYTTRTGYEIIAAVTKRIDFTSQRSGRLSAAVANVELMDGSHRLFGIRMAQNQPLITVTDGKQHQAS